MNPVANTSTNRTQCPTRRDVYQQMPFYNEVESIQQAYPMLSLRLSYSRHVLSGYCLLKHITKPMPRRTINSVCRLYLSMTVDRFEAHSSLDNQPVWPPRDFSALNIHHSYKMSTPEKCETKSTVLIARGHDPAGLSNEKVDNILLLR